MRACAVRADDAEDVHVEALEDVDVGDVPIDQVARGLDEHLGDELRDLITVRERLLDPRVGQQPAPWAQEVGRCHRDQQQQGNQEGEQKQREKERGGKDKGNGQGQGHGERKEANANNRIEIEGEGEGMQCGLRFN